MLFPDHLISSRSSSCFPWEPWAYWNSFDVPLVFDDLLSIQRNEGVRFGDYFNVNLLNGRSLLYLTFTANYFFHGQDVWGYHLVNLILHLLNGVLIYFVARHILGLVMEDSRRSRSFATLAAGFFLVHPVQTEAVTYVSSRSALLSTLFYIGALLIFIKTPTRKIGFLPEPGSGIRILPRYRVERDGLSHYPRCCSPTTSSSSPVLLCGRCLRVGGSTFVRCRSCRSWLSLARCHPGRVSGCRRPRPPSAVELFSDPATCDCPIYSNHSLARRPEP